MEEEYDEVLPLPPSEAEPPGMTQIASDLSLPPAIPVMPFAGDALPLKNTDFILVDKLITSLQDIDYVIKKKMEVIESLDISISVVSYKIYDATHDFKKQIGDIKEERNTLLASVTNESELSLILNDLDIRISHLNKELEIKLNEYNQQKVQFQEQIEAFIMQLDEDIVQMQSALKDLKIAIGYTDETTNILRPQMYILNDKYFPIVGEFEQNFLQYEQLQLTGWKIEHSEDKLAGLLEEQGLKFTPSGKLLTRAGSHITFEEAQQKGYLKSLDVSLEKIFDFFKERNLAQDYLRETSVKIDTSIFSEDSSLESKLTSEDVKYLQVNVGKSLTVALAEITAKQPRDPIHYLAHYLFKYRYNQEYSVVEKRELEELMNERKFLAEERWRKFVEQEARNAVIDMIIKAEEIAYQNELRRIEREQMLAEEEEEEMNYDELNLREEAKDKFE